MKKLVQRLIVGITALSLIFGGTLIMTQNQPLTYADATNSNWNGKAPKYIFLFIGDGMTYPQFTAASDYLGAVESENKVVDAEKLAFMDFPVVGNSTTFDSTSFCPDSASTATSISTGYKTLSGVINMDTSKTKSYETIAEKLKAQMGYKVGVVSSVPINHATPAAFYAHQASRNNYYEIGEELAASEFDYFGGGDFLLPTGKENNKKNIYDVATANGYTVAKTKEAILGLTSSNDKVIAINPTTIGGALPYEVDRKSGDLSLADFTRKGIDVLYNETGFFMMVEGGKIDWACHANDAVASIKDTIAFDDAVQEAIKFYNKYPKDTLILVTGDHETGGMTIGFAGTQYSTYLTQLSDQSMSYEAFDLKIADYRTKKTSFASVLNDIQNEFGLVTSAKKDQTVYANMVMTDYELSQLETAYNLSMIPKEERKLTDADKLLYGGYEPLSMAVTHLLNNKSGIGWTSYSHTGLPTAVFARGLGAELFSGSYDNTDVFVKLKALTKVK